MQQCPTGWSCSIAGAYSCGHKGIPQNVVKTLAQKTTEMEGTTPAINICMANNRTPRFMIEQTILAPPLLLPPGNNVCSPLSAVGYFSTPPPGPLTHITSISSHIMINDITDIPGSIVYKTRRTVSNILW